MCAEFDRNSAKGCFELTRAFCWMVQILAIAKRIAIKNLKLS